MFDAVLYIATGFMLGCGFMWLQAHLAPRWWERRRLGDEEGE
jgi:hypothetical protein